MELVKKFQLKIVIFTALTNRCILHGHVFEMFREWLFSDYVLPLCETFCNKFYGVLGY